MLPGCMLDHFPASPTLSSRSTVPFLCPECPSGGLLVHFSVGLGRNIIFRRSLVPLSHWF